MKSNIIQVHEGQLKIGSWDVAKGTKIQHRVIKTILNRYLQKNGLNWPKRKRFTKRKGGQIEEYLLGEDEMRLLFALLIEHPKMCLAFNVFILQDFGAEATYFSELEKLFDDIKELSEFEEF